ncbi:unnamed protein product [Meganyctiphanes norvegica]|uniref:Broad-complex n=1 Tax=Meganyctiphanes norvegica TaxID=48144 RepID=A0AAV2PQU6_MEGNR
MEELLSLKWNNHRSTFLHILTILRDKQAYTDVTLACDGKFYNVHKLVLSTCSDYFSAMFDKTDKTCKSPIIVLKDIKCEDLEALLDYMYLGEVNVRQCDLASLIKSAECLRIKGLAVPDDEPPKKVPNRTESNRRDNVSGSPPPKRKRREEGEDGRDDVRPIEPSPQPSTSRPKNDSSQRLSPAPHRTPQEPPSVEERLSRPPPTSTDSHSVPSTSTSGGGGGSGAGRGDGGGGSGGASVSGASGGGGGGGSGTEQFRSQSENQTFVKVEQIDDDESHDDSQIDSYNMGTDGYKEESEGDFGADLSNDLPEFLQQASSGSLQGSSFHQFPGPSGFQDASGSSWQGDGQPLAGNFSGLGFSHQEGSQNPGIGDKQLGNVCMICGKLFRGRNWKQNLEYHSLTHTKYKPFKCPMCNHSSSLKYNLIRHIRNKHRELYPQQEDSHIENFWRENHGDCINESERLRFIDENIYEQEGQ